MGSSHHKLLRLGESMSLPDLFGIVEDNVRRINLGAAGSWIDLSRKERLLPYGIVKKAYQLFLEGRHDEFLEYYQSLRKPSILSGASEFYDKGTATRYLNDMELFCRGGSEVLWITHSGDLLLWCLAERGVTVHHEYTDDSANSDEDRVNVCLVREVLLDGWKTTNFHGVELEGISKMHPKARNLLSQSATIARMTSGASYFLAKLKSLPLDPWHNRKDWVAAARKENWRPTVNKPRVPRHWDQEVNRMVASVLHTVAQSQGQIIERQVKLKTMNLSRDELAALVAELLVKQEYRCAVTKRKLKPRGDGPDNWLMPSVDRVDPDGNYERGNVQVTSWAANFAKHDLSHDQVESFFAAIQMARDAGDDQAV